MNATTLRLFIAFLCITFGAPPAASARMDDEPRKGDVPKLAPAAILAGIQQPWTGPLVEVERSLRADRDYVVWVYVPAQHPMDLRSSDHFRQWGLATPLTQLTISHNMVAYRCHNRDGELMTGATGMTGASKLQEAKALLAGFGRSVFWSTFTDGHLNPQREVDQYVTKNLKKRGAVFAAFEVTQEQCGNMLNFLTAFAHHPRRPFERFNNVGDPEKFEGGGCVTFATELLKQAGVLREVIPQFYRQFSVARFLLGGNLRPVADVEPPPTPWLQGKRHSISLNMFWTTPWELEPETFRGYVHLRQIDPEKMGYTLKQFASVYLEGVPQPRRAREAQWLASTPLGDRVSITANNLTAPERGLEFTRTRIDDQFDDQMAAVGRSARAWFRARLSLGGRIRLSSVAGMPVLVLEKP